MMKTNSKWKKLEWEESEAKAKNMGETKEWKRRMVKENVKKKVKINDKNLNALLILTLQRIINKREGGRRLEERKNKREEEEMCKESWKKKRSDYEYDYDDSWW